MAESSEFRQKVDALLQSALKLDPAKRKAFLDEACAGDPSLRQKVESRLAVEAPGPVEPRSARQSKPQPDPGVMAGELIAHYKITSFLGRGGMGEVYLAQDMRLGRKVALKLLPKALINDEERLRRFEREARSASALSHPNVCVIHEIGETEDGRSYISMEYIDGETLRRRFGRGSLKLKEAIDIAQQTASALSAAHEAGVVHRDIKPENIMLRRDGYVKVLDFGLAKLTERYETGSDSEAPTFHIFSTHSGLLIGTTNYLSPEQARRLEVDERADIWGLGVVLYEMVTGRMPFNGETPSHVIVSILESEPESLTQFLPAVPTELEWIVKKALRKDREERYQSIKELITDLGEVKQKLNELGVERSGQLASSLETPPVTRHSSAFESISQSLGQPRISIGFFALVAVLLGLASWGLFHWLKGPAIPFQNMKVTKLTNTGRSRDTTISPDGKYVVYVNEEGGLQSLWLIHVPTTSVKQIISSNETQFAGLTFSPDSNYIYYVLEKNGVGALFRMDLLGGVSQKIIENVDSHPSVSPDGQRLAFVRLNKTQGEYDLIVAKSDGSEERPLAKRTQGEFFSLYGSTAWSPDGKKIVCASGSFSGGYHMNLVEVLVENGAEKSIVSQNWFQIIFVVWPRDGLGLILAASDQTVSPFQIWYVSYPEGKVTRVTTDLADYNSLAATADSRTLVTLQVDRLTNIWVMPNGETDQAKQITSGVGHTNSVSWTPDGKLLYSSITGGDSNVWLMESDGNRKTQLTANAAVNYYPVMSPDGRFIVFASNRNGAFNIWKMNSDGSNPKQLTTGGSDVNPCFSADSQSVVYESYRNGVPMLWKVSINGGAANQLTNVYSSSAVVSPDGKTIACRYLDKKVDSQKIALITFDGGQLIKTFNVPIHYWQRIRWTPDALAFTYIDVREGIANIWRQPVDGGESKQLTTFKAEQIFSYDWSRDGKQLACERGVETSDVVLITDYLE